MFSFNSRDALRQPEELLVCQKVTGMTEKTTRHLKIGGDAIEKAIRSARESDMEISFVYELDESGNIAKVGYFFTAKGKINITQPTIKWIDKDQFWVREETSG